MPNNSETDPQSFQPQTFWRRIGELRVAMAAAAVACMLMLPWATQEVRYEGWGIVPDIIAPVLGVLLLFGLLLDMLMSRVFMASGHGERARYASILKLEAVLVAGLLLTWGPHLYTLLR